jgi:hypothetical protein
LLKLSLPFVVSGGLLYYQLSTFDMSGVLAHVKGPVGVIFVPVLLAYGAFSLWIEALCLVRLLKTSGYALRLWTAARIRAASYLIYIINYPLGAAALTALLRRRTRVGLGDAGGVVILIALFDMGILILLSGLSAAFQSSDAPAVRIGVIVAAGIGLVSGFAILRTPVSLGPIDRLRSLAMFRAARTTPPGMLLELGVLRLVFVISFMTVAWSALWVFHVRVPFGEAILNIALTTIVSTIPVAVAGLGTSQAAFVVLFRAWADEGTLLACSLTLSAGLIALRAGMGFVFSQEYVREAIEAVRQEREQI